MKSLGRRFAVMIRPGEEVATGQHRSKEMSEFEHYTVKPIYDQDRRIGSRVWDPDGIELEETDPVFRAVACGKVWHGDTPPEVTDADAAGIVGGPVIFRRIVPVESQLEPHRELPGKASERASPGRREDTLERARERLSKLRG
jgi:hypothetical protein